MIRLLAAVALAAVLAGPAAAANFTTIPQSGASADAIRQTLDGITLPAGFRIGLYAIAPGARHIAVAPEGDLVFVGTTDTQVWSVTDRDRDGVADEVRDLAPGFAKDIPNGPCLAADGTLYVAERNRVIAFAAAAANYADPDLTPTIIVPQGKLAPDAETSSHNTRVCKVGPDDKLYISLGQPHNVPPADKLDLYAEFGLGGIIRMNRDGTGREIYTRGIRNSVGHAFDPVTGDLWFTDNQVDRMGDDIPPGEINHQTGAGQTFGFPWFGGGTSAPRNMPTATRRPTRSSRWSRPSLTPPTSA